MYCLSLPLLTLVTLAGQVVSKPTRRQDQPVVNPGRFKNLDIQPDGGGGEPDKCGGNAISVDAGTWKSHDMDNLLKTFWDNGVKDPKFDFHQRFAEQYGVNLVCSTATEVCTGIPTNCDSLKGTQQQKEQGWLFVQGVLQIQQSYIQSSHAINVALQSLNQYLEDFGNAFVPESQGSNHAAGRTIVADFGTGIGAVLGVVAAGVVIGAVTPFVAAGLAVGAAISSGVATTINNHVPQLVDGQAHPLKAITSDWADLTEALLSSLDAQHGAAFSNGTADGNSVGDAILPKLLEGGAFAGTADRLKTYSQGQDSLTKLVQKVAIEGLLSSIAGASNTFQLYYPGITGDQCKAWHGQTGDNDERRLCTGNGMYIMNTFKEATADEKKKLDDGVTWTVTSPAGFDANTISNFGGFGMSLQALMTSSAQQFEKHGLGKNALFVDLNELANFYKDGSQDLYSFPGLFQVPVCKLDRNVPSDGKGSKQVGHLIDGDYIQKSMPCACLTSTDNWNQEKFIDNVSDQMKGFIQAKACK